MVQQQGAAPTAASFATSSPSTLPPLPPGWSENKAPTGHTYYYNAQTRESTYRRPTAASPPPPVPPPPRHTSYNASNPPLPGSLPAMLPQASAPFLRLSDPRVANAFMAHQKAASSPQPQHGGARRGFPDRGGRGGGRGHGAGHPRHQPVDKPRSRIAIPGHDSWILVYTKLGRRFVHNTDKNASYWRIPEKLMPAVLELDKSGIQAMVEAAMHKDVKAAKDAKANAPSPPAEKLDSDYEEVEVTDDENERVAEYEEIPDEGRRRKRQRTEDIEDIQSEVDTGNEKAERNPGGGGPIEFGEDDIAFQLAAAGDAYGSGDGYTQGEWDSQDEFGGDQGPEDGQGEGEALFRELLDDFQINPFSPWEKLLEEGKVFDDPRYKALPNMKARRGVWEAWSREAIHERKEAKERELAAAAEIERQKPRDPRAAYLQLLQDHATPKLYWPEFKRKYRKEPALKDSAAPYKEKEKEKLYRDYVARRKLPASTRIADLTKLLTSLPRDVLHSQTDVASLPIELTGDLRYVAIEPQTRDELVEAFLKTLGPP